MEENKKIGFIGDKTSVGFFKIFGAEIFPATTVEEAVKIIKNISFADYSIIFITEEVFDRDLFSKYVMRKQLLPLPSLTSNIGKGYQIVEDLIRTATGMKE
jgi:vacuolar-type H+-ATPase subunit F/Vma7